MHLSTLEKLREVLLNIMFHLTLMGISIPLMLIGIVIWVSGHIARVAPKRRTGA